MLNMGESHDLPSLERLKIIEAVLADLASNDDSLPGMA